MPSPDYSTFHPATRKAWRNWLEKNHASSPGIWMIYYKKITGKRKLPYHEAIEEALCFGWIDSAPRKLDQHRAMVKFTPRKPKSAWSKINKERVDRLINQRLMATAGLLKINQAKKDGSWHKLSNADTHIDNNSLPPELKKAFLKNKKALENFKAFPPGYRKRFFFWIDSAKKPATKMARIRQTLLMAAANKKPGPKGFKLDD